MDNIKYQVFISSTYTDLIEERRKVLDVLLMADCIPAGMEAFVATDLEQFEVIKKVIDYCDYYVLIIGKRYGSISPETDISYTEMEYDYAISKGIPVLVFALDESVELPKEKVDSDPLQLVKLKKFREKAMTNRMATIWHTPDELTGHLAISIMKAKSEIKRPGWQRAVNYDEASLRRTIMDLQTDNERLYKDVSEKQSIIDSLMEQNNIAFEDCNIKFDYYYFKTVYSGSKLKSKKVSDNKSIPLVELFKVISLEMLDVAVAEKIIVKAIKSKLFKEDNDIYFSDSQIVKQVLMQLSELKLIYSFWSDSKSTLFWNLTEKGEKLRNDYLLIRNQQQSNEGE